MGWLWVDMAVPRSVYVHHMHGNGSFHDFNNDCAIVVFMIMNPTEKTPYSLMAVCGGVWLCAIENGLYWPLCNLQHNDDDMMVMLMMVMMIMW